MIIYPAVDILDGRCVRLRQGRYDEVTNYDDDPVAAALNWEAEGAQFMHVVDLNGAADGVPKNIKVIEKIASALRIPIQVGGGVRDLPTLEILFELGISRIVLGTSLIVSPQFIEEACLLYGDRLVAGLDAHEGKIAISGWTQRTERGVIGVAKELEGLGISRIIFTDIAVDGTQSGLNLEAIESLAKEVMIPIIASGGVAALEDIERLKAYEALGIDGVIIGRALYENAFTLPQAIAAAR